MLVPLSQPPSENGRRPMTTAPHASGWVPRPASGVLGPVTATVLAGLVVVAAGALTGGLPAAAGAAAGAVLVTVVFAFGAVAVGFVAMVAPAASLLVSLLTYTLQVVAVGLFYLALGRGGVLDGPVDPRWLSAAVIGCTLVWTTAHIVAVRRTRIPLYDLPDHREEASVR